MIKQAEKPSAEAKALSLFLMAYKSKDPIYKEKLKRINKRWDLVKTNAISKTEYMEEVLSMLESYGGYSVVVEKTVQFYIETTGEWKLKGEDKYCMDAKVFVETFAKK